MNLLISTFVAVEKLGYVFLYEKVPHIPENVRRPIAKYFPYVMILLLAWRLYALIGYIQFQFASPSARYLYQAGEGGYGVLGIMFVGMAVVLGALSIPGLLKYRRTGWIFIYVSELLIVLNNGIHLNLLNFFAGGLLMMYLLFQVRSYYHD